MESAFHELKRTVDSAIWKADLRETRGVHLWALRAGRMIYVVIRDLLTGELNLRAMSLVYTTLLSIVPLLAVSFSVLKAFGVHHEVAPLLRDFLSPLGEDGLELADYIVSFVENVQVGLLGAVGIGLLIYTAVSLMHKIEMALNFVWHIDSLRSFGRRLSGFLSVILVGPILVLSALGITASLRSTTVAQAIERIEPFGRILQTLSQLVPYLLVWVAFTFIYLFVPNTRVRFSAAVRGGLVGAVLWQSAGLFFATFITSSARYAAVYSSFAILILALIWVYLNWLILLVGAQVAFYIQNPHYLTRMPVRLALSNRMKESLSLAVIYLIGDHHIHHRPPHNVESLADRLELPTGPVEAVLSLLQEAGFVEPNANDPPGYLPARDLGTIEIRQLLAAVRTAGETPLLNERRATLPPPARKLAAEVVQHAELALDTRTVRDMFPDADEARSPDELDAGPGPHRR